tara:strand:+ start:874 stop:1080 length:207 start_codon:yes stop_codon:yes gene_type:complete
MSETVYENLKNKLEQLYKKNLSVEIGIYDDNNNLCKERLIPLGNYIYNSMPSNSEQRITQKLCSRITK